ncbi:MAG: hypothetical protein Q4C54_06010 [Clostridia bacterium]|nr:hypothetical protein [Clostridia bacterium]
MKKLWCILLIVMLLGTATAMAESRTIILMTSYQQLGWGERFSFGALDDEGNLWTYSSLSRDGVPFEDDELLTWAETTDLLEEAGSISSNSLFDIKSLVNTVQPQEEHYSSDACDAGTQKSFACRGKDDIVLLGTSGDSMFENTTPAAQSLYRTLRKLFPKVPSFNGDPYISPAGFQPVPLLEFCGYVDLDLTGLTVSACAMGCETGAEDFETELTPADFAAMTVTGMHSATMVTGGTDFYYLKDKEGNTAACIEFFGDLLVMPGGMYYVR